MSFNHLLNSKVSNVCIMIKLINLFSWCDNDILMKFEFVFDLMSEEPHLNDIIEDSLLANSLMDLIYHWYLSLFFCNNFQNVSNKHYRFYIHIVATDMNCYEWFRFLNTLRKDCFNLRFREIHWADV